MDVGKLIGALADVATRHYNIATTSPTNEIHRRHMIVGDVLSGLGSALMAANAAPPAATIREAEGDELDMSEAVNVGDPQSSDTIVMQHKDIRA